MPASAARRVWRDVEGPRWAQGECHGSFDTWLCLPSRVWEGQLRAWFTSRGV